MCVSAPPNPPYMYYPAMPVRTRTHGPARHGTVSLSLLFYPCFFYFCTFCFILPEKRASVSFSLSLVPLFILFLLGKFLSDMPITRVVATVRPCKSSFWQRAYDGWLYNGCDGVLRAGVYNRKWEKMYGRPTLLRASTQLVITTIVDPVGCFSPTMNGKRGKKMKKWPSPWKKKAVMMERHFFRSCYIIRKVWSLIFFYLVTC